MASTHIRPEKSADERAHMARVLGLLQLVAVGLSAVWVLVPGKTGVDTVGVLVVVGVICVVAGALLYMRTPLPFAAFPIILAFSTTAVGLGINFSSGHLSPLVLFYIWVPAYAAWFFPRRWLALETAWVIVSYGLLLGPLDVHESGFDGVDLAQWLLVSGSVASSAVLIRAFKSQLSDQELRRENELRHHAFHDELTGLPNRALLVDRLTQTLAHCRRSAGQAAVLLLDLDDLKHVNDSLGHDAGDEVLKALATRLEAVVRPSDSVARVSADTFAVVCGDLEDHRAAVSVADRMLYTVREPLHLGGEELVVSASVGIALADASRTAEELIRDADAAAHRAKARGGNRYEVFDQALRARILARLNVENGLRRALAQEELLLHYQPIVSLHTGKPVGFEGLLRWRHPERGMVMPDEFIPVAEESGLIVPVGRFVIERACRQLGRWRAADPEFGACLSVNVSARELAAPGFLESLRRILADTGTDPGNLTLELTETTLMDELDSPLELITALKDIGVELALDDFGTGYSSLGHLKRFPLDVVKVDRSLVDEVASDSDSRAIVGAAITMASALGRRVIAEGIETPEQMGVLRVLGCELGQGFLFARPMPPERVLRWAAREPQHVR